jgi:hypothetical protein
MLRKQESGHCACPHEDVLRACDRPLLDDGGDGERQPYGAVFDRAIGFFDLERLADRDCRNERLDGLEATELESFDRLTDELHALEDADGSIYVAITRCIDAHAEMFFI